MAGKKNDSVIAPQPIIPILGILVIWLSPSSFLLKSSILDWLFYFTYFFAFINLSWVLPINAHNIQLIKKPQDYNLDWIGSLKTRGFRPYSLANIRNSLIRTWKPRDTAFHLRLQCHTYIWVLILHGKLILLFFWLVRKYIPIPKIFLYYKRNIMSALSTLVLITMIMTWPHYLYHLLC